MVHIDSKPKVAQQKQGFLGAYQVGVLQQRHCAGDSVVEDVRLAGEQAAACGIFVLDDFGDDGLFELRDDLRLRDAERYLVGELIKVAGGLGSLAEEPSDGKAHIPCGVEEFFDLAGHLQGGQVKHHRDSYSCADVGRAGSEVSEARAEGIIDLLLYHIVDLVYLLGALGELAAGLEDLDSQVVFLVNHSGKELPLCHYDASRAFAEGVVSADEMSLDEEVFAQGGRFIDADVIDLVAEVERHQHLF